jgi:predicted porin
MNKKLLALAVGAAFGAAPMFASAGVTVYGHAQVEVGTVDNGTTDQTVVEDNARGRIGIKADEKLGNGMTAIAKYEFRTDTADNVRTADGGPLTAREAFVGLKGNFGTVQLGNLKSAYKYSGGVTYDPFVATLIEARGANGMSGGELGGGKYGHNSFLSNNIGYMSPKIGGGFTGWVTYSPDEGAGTGGDYSFGLKFAQKAWEVFVAGINNDEPTPGVGGEGIKFGGMYKFGNFKITGQYETLSFNLAGKSDTDIYFVGGQAKFGNNVLVAQFGNKDPGGALSDLNYYTIGLIHNLSKKTRLTAGFRSFEQGATGNVDVDTFAVGMRMKF